MLDRMLARLPRVTAPLQHLGSHVAAFLYGAERQTLQRFTRRAFSPRHLRGWQPKETPELPPKRGCLLPSKNQRNRGSRCRTAARWRLEFRPDFALWLSGARGQLPRPVVLELLGQETGQRKLDHLEKYSLDSRIGAIMLIDELEALPLTLVRRMPMIYQIGISDFEMLLQDARLVPEMVRASALQHVLKANAQIR